MTAGDAEPIWFSGGGGARRTEGCRAGGLLAASKWLRMALPSNGAPMKSSDDLELMRAPRAGGSVSPIGVLRARGAD